MRSKPCQVPGNMERLDQGHLHRLLGHSKLTCPGRGLNLRPPVPHACTLAKNYLDSLQIWPFWFASWLPTVWRAHSYTLNYPWIVTGNQALASHSPLNNQAFAIHVFESRRGHTMERLDQGHLHPLLGHPRQTFHGQILNLRPSQPQVGTLTKDYLDSYTTNAKPIKIKKYKI